MMQLNHYDFRDEFTLHEVVSLSIGHEPRLGTPKETDPAWPAYKELRLAAIRAVSTSNAACAFAHFAGESQEKLHKGLLYTEWALERIPVFTPTAEDQRIPFGHTEIPKDQWPEKGFNPDDTDSWLFSRKTISNWFSGRPFKPVYDFSPPGAGSFVRGQKEEIEPKPLGNRERNTLLTIIAVLCKEAKIDYTKPAKAASLIQSTAAKMGVNIGESTIEAHRKKITDALETRMT